MPGDLSASWGSLLTIPFTGALYDWSSKRVPGWRELVEPYRQTSMFWYNLWVECCYFWRMYTWRKGLRRVWSLPYNTNTVLLAPLSDSIALTNEICRRTLSYSLDCLSSNYCNLMSFVSRYAVNFCGMFLQIGCNVLFCCERYQQVITVDNVFNCSLRPNAIHNYCIPQVSDDWRTTVSRLLELIMLRKNVMLLSHLSFVTLSFAI